MHTIRVLLLVITAAVVSVSTQAMSQQPAAQPAERPVTVKALQDEQYKKGGLRAAAGVTGSYTRSERQYWEGDPATLKELADLSHLVVIGRWETGRSELTPDGRSINTVHSVVVESMIKGEPETSTLAVVLPGGKAQFDDGATSEVTTPGFARPQIARRVMWFLRRENGKRNSPQNPDQVRYIPTRGPLGIFDLEPEGRRFIAPAGSFAGPLAKRLLQQRLSADAFLEAVTGTLR
jgi:hypothetical protein